MPVFADASVVGDGDAYHGCGEEGEEFHNDFVGINSLTCENLVDCGEGEGGYVVHCMRTYSGVSHE